jgi:hypothetical protein
VTKQYELVCKAEISLFGLQALHEANDRVGEGGRPDGLIRASQHDGVPAGSEAGELILKFSQQPQPLTSVTASSADGV